MRRSLPLLLLSSVLPISQALGQGPKGKPNGIDGLRRATVYIEATVPSGTVTGSGFILTADGLVATAAHVLAGASTAKVRLASGDEYDIQGVSALDTARDFAIVRIPGFGLPVVQLGNSDSVAVGTRLVAVGAPLGLEATVADGLLSSIRVVEGRRLLQISIPTSPGSSGCPIATQDGQVVGLDLAGIRGEGAENLNFALPINYIRGELALAQQRAPTPLAQATSGIRTAGTATEPLASDVPARVNDSLRLDWWSLDGASFYTQSNDHHKTISGWVSYSRTTSLNGKTVLERYSRSTWNEGFEDRFRDQVRTVIDDQGNYHTYYERVPLDPQYSAMRTEAAVDTGLWDGTGPGFRRSARVPRGVLGADLEGAAVAALPDTLPHSVYIWFVQWDSMSTRPVPVRFDFGAPDSVDVPLAQPGQLCDTTTAVHRRKMAVVSVTVTAEARRETFQVLARRPHFKISDDLACVGLPVRLEDLQSRPRRN